MNKIITIALLVSAVISTINGKDGLADLAVDDFDDEKQPIVSNSATSARLRRAIMLGHFKEQTSKQGNYKRRILKHSFESGPEGNVKINTQHHHENRQTSEQTNREGHYRVNNNRGWNNY